jgi:outer membrane protein assembly factor BamB
MRLYIGFVFAAVLCLAHSIALAQAFDWPQWQGPHRNGLASETDLLQEWPAGRPRQRWLYRECGVGYGGPAIAAEKLFILGTRDDQSQLFALDVETGAELWAAPVGPVFENDWGDGPRGTPAIAGNLAYALSADGSLICARTVDGKEMWRTTMQSLGGRVPYWGYSSSVLIDGDKLVCTPGGKKGAIAALDRHTGKIIWQSSDVPGGAHYSSVVRADFHGVPQYVQLLEKRLVGVSASGGRLLWEVPWPGSVAVIPTPFGHGNRVFVTSGYGAGCMLVEIALQNEVRKVYANKSLKNKHGGFIAIDDHAYGYSDDAGWVCVALDVGELIWREREALGKGAIAYADGRLYCIDEQDGNVVLIEPSPGGWQEHGRFTLAPQSTHRKPQGRIWAHPVVADGKLFLRDQEFVYCYDVKQP